jgi:hypothetical protein
VTAAEVVVPVVVCNGNTGVFTRDTTMDMPESRSVVIPFLERAELADYVEK